MTSDGGKRDAPRELQLEGFRLILLAVVLVAVLAGAFLAGRWVGRRSRPADLPAGQSSDPLSGVGRDVAQVDTTEGLDYFDRLGGDAKELEPQREARTAETAGTPASAETGPLAATEEPPADGPYLVQVFAGRDRASAETLVERLKRTGYRVRIIREAEGPSALFKVRVGGYAGRDEALAVARELQGAGYPGAWVPPVE